MSYSPLKASWMYCSSQSGALSEIITLIELGRVLKSQQAEVKLSMAEVVQLEEKVCAAERDLEWLCVAHVLFNELTAERGLLTRETDLAKI